jgi:hypothetical protein
MAEEATMLYWGLGFLVLAIVTLILGAFGVPGAGQFTTLAFVASLVLLGLSAVSFGHLHYTRRRRPLPTGRA